VNVFRFFDRRGLREDLAQVLPDGRRSPNRIPVLDAVETRAQRAACGGFLDQALAYLPEGYRLYTVRADSGFFDATVLSDLEQRPLPYATAVRLTKPLRRQLVGIKSWQEFAPGLEVGELMYETYGWRTARRFPALGMNSTPVASRRTHLSQPCVVQVVLLLASRLHDSLTEWLSRRECRNTVTAPFWCWASPGCRGPRRQAPVAMPAATARGMLRRQTPVMRAGQRVASPLRVNTGASLGATAVAAS
jgi:hypothetical protein